MSEPVLWRHPKAELLARLSLAPASRVLISAAAGTGKTESTCQAAIAQLLEQGVAPESILIVAFNENAARESRARFREIVERLLGPPESEPPADADCFEITPSAQRVLAAALRAGPVIRTIHSWAGQVLEDHPLRAGVPLAAELVGRAGAFKRAFLGLLRGTLARDHAADLELWLSHRSLERLEVLLRRASDEHTSTLLRPALDHDAIAAALEEVAGTSRRTWTQLRRAIEDKQVIANWKTRNALRPILDSLPERARALADSGARLAPHDPSLVGDVSYVVSRLGANPPSGCGALLKRLEALRQLQVGLDAAAASLFTQPAREAYRETKRARNEIDYDDLLVLLDEALASPQGAALRQLVRQEVELFVNDEFQDANKLIYSYRQGELARGLIRPLWLEQGYPGRAVLCGDGRQSIYSWRGADVHASFLRAKQELQARGAVESLRRSYRATPRLVAAMNELFRQDASPAFFQGEIDYSEPMEVGRPGLRALGPAGQDVEPIRLLEVTTSSQRLRADELRAAVNLAIARRIHGLRSDDPITLVEDGREQPVGLDEVFVLTRGHRDAAEVARVLRSFDPPIPCVVQRSSGLFGTPEAADVLDLLAGLARPSDGRLRRRAFLTPFLAVPLERLPSLRELPADHPLLRRWYRWVDLAERDVSRLLALLVDESGLAARELLDGLEARSASVYRQVLEELRLQATRLAGGVSELLVSLEQLIAESSDDERQERFPVRQDASVPSVQIQTAYAAKGQGAALVLIAASGITGRSPKKDPTHVYRDPEEGEDDRPRYDRGDAPPQLELFVDEKGQRVLHVGNLDDAALALWQDSEREASTFLHYVAITRAKAQVVIPTVAWLEDEAEWLYPRLAGSYYEPLNECLRRLIADREADPGLRELVSCEEIAAEPEPAPPDPAQWEEGLASWSPPAHLLGPIDEGEGRSELRRAHRAQRVVSYSSLKRDLVEAGELPPPEAVDGASAAPAGIGRELLRGGKDTGNYLHALLEHAPREGLLEAEGPASWGAREEVAEVLARVQEAYGTSAAEAEVARDMVFHTLRRPLDLGEGVSLPGFASCPSLQEASFRFPLPELQGVELAAGRLALRRGFVSGVIDEVFRPPASPGGEPALWCADWKSDVLEDYSAESMRAHVENDYAYQLALYLVTLKRLARVEQPEDLGRLGGMLYVFLRASGLADPTPSLGVCVIRPSWETLLAYERALEEIA